MRDMVIYNIHQLLLVEKIALIPMRALLVVYMALMAWRWPMAYLLL